MQRRTVVLQNYAIDEGACKCGCGMQLQDELLLVQQAFNAVLSRAYGAPIRHVLTSGARCAKHNAEVGGESDSQHVGGGATDGYWEYKHRGKWIRMEPQDVAAAAVKSGLFGGVGYRRYLKAGTNIVHLDIRPGPAVVW